MADAVDRDVAEGYRDFFLALCDTYGSDFWICAAADWLVRSEFAEDEKLRQLEWHASNPANSGFDPLRP